MAAVIVIGLLIFYASSLRRSVGREDAQPAPDYQNASAWLALGAGADGAAVFLVPSPENVETQRWNAPNGSDLEPRRTADADFDVEAAPFLRIARVAAPLYRRAQPGAAEATDNARGDQRAEDDIRRAFLDFIKRTDDRAPIFLAGYGRGARHLAGLMREHFQPGSALLPRLAAAYVIDVSDVPAMQGAGRACEGAEDVRCVVAIARSSTAPDPFPSAIEQDARRRLASLRRRLSEEARALAPIDQSVDIPVSPVKKAPRP